ncbi:MAG: hypothetical protein WCG27_04050 [Pseudomonadota bacterium]
MTYLFKSELSDRPNKYKLFYGILLVFCFILLTLVGAYIYQARSEWMYYLYPLLALIFCLCYCLGNFLYGPPRLGIGNDALYLERSFIFKKTMTKYPFAGIQKIILEGDGIKLIYGNASKKLYLIPKIKELNEQLYHTLGEAYHYFPEFDHLPNIYPSPMRNALALANYLETKLSVLVEVLC